VSGQVDAPGETKMDFPPSLESLSLSTRRGNLIKEKDLMENTQEELKAHLMQTDEEFRHLATEHAQYHEQLEALESKGPQTEEDEVEEHRLKKLKLRLKDQMNEILARYRHEQVV